MKARTVAAVALGALAVSCGGAGPSCGGCGPADYTFPSKVMQGTETIDDGVRARMTERGLDFLASHFKDILRQQFPPDPTNPNASRIELPTQKFLDQDSSFGDITVCLQGNSLPPPPECANPYDANKVTSILVDLTDLESKITVDFISQPAHGIRVTARGLLLGLDGRIRTEVVPFGTELFRTNADCDVYGDTTLAGAPFGTLGSIDVVADIYPRVSTDPTECLNGAPQCFMADIQVTNAALNDVGLGVTTPIQCSSETSRNPEGCSPACSDVPDLQFCGGSTSCYSGLTCFDPTGDCECRSLLCPGYAFGADVISQMADFFFTILQPFLGDIMTGALSRALDSFNGTALAFNGQMDIAQFAGGMVPGLGDANKIGFAISPTNSAFSVTCPSGQNSCNERRGMDMYLKTGVEAVHEPEANKPSPSECVPLVEGAKFLQLYAAAAFETPDGAPLSGEFIDSQNTARVYDVGASLARAALNQMGFSIYNAGVLCLGLDSWAIHGLTGGAFELTAGALDLLTGGRLGQYVDPKAPMVLTIAPEEPPVFTLGAGTEDDPHLQLDLNKLHVNVYVLMYERYVRLFEVIADVNAGLNITPDPVTSELRIAVASGPTIENFTQVYNELLPDVDFGEVLPALINVALGALLNQEIAFNYDISPLLSDALGGVPIYIVFEALQAEQVGNSREFLNLYLSFSDIDPTPIVLPVRLDVQPHREVQTWWKDEQGTYHATGFARLTGVMAPLPQEFVYSWQVDFGPWHDWVEADPDGVLYVMDSKLALVGHHTVNVRAMRRGDFASQTRDWKSISVWTDHLAPRVFVNKLEGRVSVRAEDRVAPAGLLEMRWRLDDGNWHGWEPVRDLGMDELEDAVDVEIAVRDPAGNIATPQKLRLRSIGTRPADDAVITEPAAVHGEEKSCVCASPANGAPWLAALFVAFLLGRRRR